MLTPLVAAAILISAVTVPVCAQNDHDDPFTAEPYFVTYDGSFQSAARQGITVDTVDANSHDVSRTYFAQGTVSMYAGPEADARVVHTYQRGDSLWVGRSYTSGWAMVWDISTEHGEIIGWVRRDNPNLDDDRPLPRYTRRTQGRSGDWFWIQYPDPISDKPVAWAQVPATGTIPPFDADLDATLLFFCDEEEGRKIVIRDPASLFTLGGERLYAELRVDDNDAVSGSTGFNTIGDASILPSGWHSTLTRQVRVGSTMYARIYDIQGTPHSYRFSLSGSSAAIAKAYCFTDVAR
jgi:hypothetical protein